VSKALRNTALGVTVAAAGMAFLAARGYGRVIRVPAASAPIRPASLEQAKTDELFRLNAKLASAPGLASEYDAINAQFFDGRLPAVAVRWEARLAEIGPMIAVGFRLEGATDGHLILLNPALQDDQQALRRTLCHEIVHVATRDQVEPHGPLFQSRLRKLSEQGAFTGTVATEEEKQELSRTVGTATSELEKTAASLRRVRSELDADTAQVQADVDDFNARSAAANQRGADWPAASERESVDVRRRRLEERVADYDFRLRRHNDGVADANRLIEQYNLMVAYPDGLDRERLAHQAAVGAPK
jgi:hypothetical protein